MPLWHSCGFISAWAVLIRAWDEIQAGVARLLSEPVSWGADVAFAAISIALLLGAAGRTAGLDALLARRCPVPFLVSRGYRMPSTSSTNAYLNAASRSES